MYLDGCVGEMELAHMYIIYTHVLYDCVCMYLDGCVGEMELARHGYVCGYVCTETVGCESLSSLGM